MNTNHALAHADSFIHHEMLNSPALMRNHVDNIHKVICDHYPDHTVVVCGIASSAVVAAYRMVYKGKIALVRKPQDKNVITNTVKVVGNRHYFNRWVFVDDTIATGSTIMHCYRELQYIEPSAFLQFGCNSDQLYRKTVYDVHVRDLALDLPTYRI